MTHPALTALANEPYLNLETFKRNGDGVKTPVWFAERGGVVYVFTDGTSYKVKRIRRDERARVAACDVSGRRIKSSWFDAKASLVEAGDELDAAYAALRKKYGLQMAVLDVGSKLAGRFGRRAMIRLDPV